MNHFTPFIDRTARDHAYFVIAALIFSFTGASILAALSIWVAR